MDQDAWTRSEDLVSEGGSLMVSGQGVRTLKGSE